MLTWWDQEVEAKQYRSIYNRRLFDNIRPVFAKFGNTSGVNDSGVSDGSISLQDLTDVKQWLDPKNKYNIKCKKIKCSDPFFDFHLTFDIYKKNKLKERYWGFNIKENGLI